MASDTQTLEVPSFVGPVSMQRDLVVDLVRLIQQFLTMIAPPSLPSGDFFLHGLTHISTVDPAHPFLFVIY